jgi:uncharacterized membrane protein YqgA involved in biofilm formation
MFLTGTLLNALAVIVGTTIGLAVGSRMPERLRSSLTDGLGLFVLALGMFMATQVFTDPNAETGDGLVVLGGLLLGVVAGELLRIHDGLEALGAWFQRRLARGDRPSRIAEGFVTASLVFCVGPLTILGSLDNGLRGDINLLATKSLLDGVAAIAFAAALGAGVYLSAITVLVIQGLIAAAAFLLRDVMDPRTVLIVTAVGGLLILGIGLRLLEMRQVRVASFLPGLLFAPLLLRLADALRSAAP